MTKRFHEAAYAGQEFRVFTAIPQPHGTVTVRLLWGHTRNSGGTVDEQIRRYGAKEALLNTGNQASERWYHDLPKSAAAKKLKSWRWRVAKAELTSTCKFDSTY